MTKPKRYRTRRYVLGVRRLAFANDPLNLLSDGAQVAELTKLLPELVARGWPHGIPIIARRERPRSGAQLRLTDVDGRRVTVFATNSPGDDLARLEVTHRLRPEPRTASGR